MTDFLRTKSEMDEGIPRKLKKRSKASYEIVVMGRLDPGWASFFGETPVVIKPDCQGKALTCLTCEVRTQAELFRVLDKLYDFNLSLYSIRLLSLTHLVQKQPAEDHRGISAPGI